MTTEHNAAGQPVWEQDFPHTSAGEEEVTRRAFTRYVIAGSGAFAAASIGVAAWTALRELPTGIDQPITDLDALPEGASRLFRYPGPDDPAVLVHLSGGELAAYSQKCTHLGCVVFWEAEDQEFVCPCHEGIFDATTGAPVAGPPQRALPQIQLDVRNDTIWAVGITR